MFITGTQRPAWADRPCGQARRTPAGHRRTSADNPFPTPRRENRKSQACKLRPP